MMLLKEKLLKKTKKYATIIAKNNNNNNDANNTDNKWWINGLLIKTYVLLCFQNCFVCIYILTIFDSSFKYISCFFGCINWLVTYIMLFLEFSNGIIIKSQTNTLINEGKKVILQEAVVNSVYNNRIFRLFIFKNQFIMYLIMLSWIFCKLWSVNW